MFFFYEDLHFHLFKYEYEPFFLNILIFYSPYIVIPYYFIQPIIYGQYDI